jgi:CopG family nickel-responsive transcriptional regulator
MSKLTRFGVSLETNLLAKFDALIEKIGYKSRSEAIRDLIRERLVTEEWKKEDQEVVGILSLVYNHASREVTDLLTRIQHRHLDVIISSTHIHLDAHNCLEVIILRGQNALVTKIADELLSTKSVKHGKLIRTTTGQNIS